MIPSFKRMSPPSTRAEFEERMHVLREHIQERRIRFAEGLRVQDSLIRVRLLPNGRIDLLSIDESARLQANMLHQMETGGFGDMSAFLNPDASTEANDEDPEAGN